LILLLVAIDAEISTSRPGRERRPAPVPLASPVFDVLEAEELLGPVGGVTNAALEAVLGDA